MIVLVCRSFPQSTYGDFSCAEQLTSVALNDDLYERWCVGPIGAADWPMGAGGVRSRVGAFEAKNKLGQLLDPVDTRNGKEVARLVPVRRGALRRIRERAEQSKLGRFDWTEWKSCRDEGSS